MYKIYALRGEDRYLLHDPRLKNIRVGAPYFENGDNINGQAEFDVYKNHPYYEYVQKMTTEIVFYDDGDEVFRGRVLYDDEDMNGTKHVFVEGQLAYLCDTIQRPAVYHNVTVENYLGQLLAHHNAYVEPQKRFYLGRVTVVDSNDSIYRYSNYETTRECIQDKLLDRLGGHLVIRWDTAQSGARYRYLDYLTDEDFYTNCSQKIQFGKNMLDFSRTITAADIATCVIPLGYKLPDSQQNPNLQEQRLTIESVNDNCDWIESEEAVANFGSIFKTVIDDDITKPANLLAFGRKYLRSSQYAQLVLEMKAVDLGMVDNDTEKFGIGKRIRCVSKPHGMDVWLPLSKIKVYITDLSKNTVTIGDQSAIMSYTSSNKKTQKALNTEIQTIQSTETKIYSEVQEKTTATEVVEIIGNQSSNVRLMETALMWSNTYSRMGSDGKITCSGAEISGAGISGGTVTDAAITSTYGTMKTVINDAVLTGYHNTDQIGKLELSKAVSYDGGITTSYDAVMSSNNNLVFEAGTARSVKFYIGGVLCGYIDANGWNNAPAQGGGS